MGQSMFTRKDDEECLVQNTRKLRWSFIQKIYMIVSIQLLFTIAVAFAVLKFDTIQHFFATSWAGMALYIVLVITPFAVLCSLYWHYKTDPLNYFLLGLFTVSVAFAIGLTCAYTSGKEILLSVILTAVVVFCLTFYTFWAATRNHEFNFWGPFLFSVFTILVLFLLIQIYYHPGKTSVMIYGGLASIICCGLIIYHTVKLFEKTNYNPYDYIWASVELYLAIFIVLRSLYALLKK